MKRISAILMLAMVIGAVAIPVYAKEKVNPKYYRDMLEPIDQEIVLLEDNSKSMSRTFFYEKGIIDYHLSEINFNKEFTISNSDVWSVLNAIKDNYDCIVVSSDLWNTGGVELEATSNKKIAILVPYRSTNEEGKKHVEQVVSEEILPYWTNSTIAVIYLDTFIEVYDGEVFMD